MTIEVKQIRADDPFEFEVLVRRSGKESRHRVTADRRTWERLTAGRHTPERCVESSFRFLLDREPQEAILRQFDISVISRYFPEFERELPGYLARS